MKFAVFCIVLVCVTAGWSVPPDEPKDVPPLPVLPPCKLKNPPWKNPELCREKKKSKCSPRTCLFTIKKGYIYINQKKVEVKVTKPKTIKVVECRNYLNKCSNEISFPCRCKYMGKRIFEDLYIAKKIEGKWKSVKTWVQVNIPGGCRCAEANRIIT
ncbi:uncharacterized protein LOC120340344 [Styela clava]